MDNLIFVILIGVFLCKVQVIFADSQYMHLFSERMTWLDAHRKCRALEGHLAGVNEVEPFLIDVTEMCGPVDSIWLGNFTTYTPILQFEGYVEESAIRIFVQPSHTHNITSREQCAVICSDDVGFTVSNDSCICLSQRSYRNITTASSFQIFNSASKGRTQLYLYYDKIPERRERCVLEFCKASVSEDVKSSAPEVENCSHSVEVYAVCRDSLKTGVRRDLSVMVKSWKEAFNACRTESYGGLLGKLTVEQCRQLRLIYGDKVMNVYLWTNVKNYQRSFTSKEFQLSSTSDILEGSLQVSWLEKLPNFTLSSSVYNSENKRSFICMTDTFHDVNPNNSCSLDTVALRTTESVPVVVTPAERAIPQVEDAGMEVTTIIIVASVLIFIILVCLVVKLIVLQYRNKRDRKHGKQNGIKVPTEENDGDETLLMELDTSTKDTSTMESILLQFKSLNQEKS